MQGTWAAVCEYLDLDQLSHDESIERYIMCTRRKDHGKYVRMVTVRCIDGYIFKVEKEVQSPDQYVHFYQKREKEDANE